VPEQPRAIGRYRLYDEIAAGGMGSVSIGRLIGPAGFSKTVAIKRLHRQFAADPEFVTMFLDEARLAARIRHPNVASILDVVASEGELIVVMEYIHGESLSKLRVAAQASGEPIPPKIAVSVMVSVLTGLHAAHEATGDQGEPLQMVHRDVSPQNVLVGADGIARVVDFGIAKAVGRLQTTRDGRVKGKYGYMAPEQVRLRPTDRRTDVYSASIVLWELLVGRRMRSTDPDQAILEILRSKPERPSALVPEVPAELDAIVLKGLERRPDARHASAREMAVLLENALTPATPREVGEFVERVAPPQLAERARRVLAIESESADPEMEKSAATPDGGTLEATQNTDLSASSARHAPHRARGVATGLLIGLGIAGVAFVALRRNPPPEPAKASSPEPSASVAAIPSARLTLPMASVTSASEPDAGSAPPAHPKSSVPPVRAKSNKKLEFDTIKRK
jgi:serine/threonine-protein kinase